MKHVKNALVLWGTYIALRKVLATNASGFETASDLGVPPSEYKKEAVPVLSDRLALVNNDGILKAIYRYDNSKHRSLVHVRFDKLTVERLNKFKLATKVDMSKLIAFAVDHLFETQPELITEIRKYIQNTAL